MYISRIQLENIRGFGSGNLRVDLDLRRPDGRYAGWTVIAGRNGSGKSTLLKAIALAAVGPLDAKALQPSFIGWVREGEKRATAAVSLIFDGAVDGIEWLNESFSSPLNAELNWASRRPGHEPALVYPIRHGEPFRAEPNGGALYSPEMEDPLFQGPWGSAPVGWFIEGYGASRRLGKHTLEQTTRLASLFNEDGLLADGVQWLREWHLRRLEQRPGAEALLEVVFDLLNDGLLPDATRVEKVDSEGLWVEQRGISLPLKSMSDGYRAVVALVLDLIGQVHAAQDGLDLIRVNGKWCVDYPGVVLIDEVEMHLHLAWQRRIGFWLKTHFPKIQFIVTTHSPFVCQAADPRGLIRLPAPGEDRTAEHVSDELYKTVVNGTVDEAALTELFGLEHVHSDQSERLRERVSQLEGRVLEGEATDEERAELEWLAAQLPSTGSALVDRAVRKFGLDK